MVSGRACFGTALRIVDEEGKELPRDGKAVGHLRAKGPWVSSGYMKLKEGLDPDGWLITGDMAVIDPMGHVSLTDRSKDVIKSGGEWISSIQLEDCALSHPEVLQAAVIAIAHEKWQERPLLLAVRKQGSTLDAKTLLDHMRPKIASWWMPDAVEFLDEFPMTGTGKVQKMALREKFKGYKPPGKTGAVRAAANGLAALRCPSIRCGGLLILHVTVLHQHRQNIKRAGKPRRRGWAMLQGKWLAAFFGDCDRDRIRRSCVCRADNKSGLHRSALGSFAR